MRSWTKHGRITPYFQTLANTNVKCYISPYRCLGGAWGETEDGVSLHVHANLAGTYNIMVVGTRMDQAAIDEYKEYGVEYVDK